MTKDDLIKLTSSDYHESIGIFPKWRIGDKSGNMNEIYPYYDSDQCEAILDDVCGIDGWGCEYREVAGILFCAIQIHTENGVIEKSDAGGARASRKKSIGETDKATFEAKTAASGAFVRAASRIGIGRHLKDLPKIVLTVQNNIAITPDGTRLSTPEKLSSYCNKMSPAILHLAWAYNMAKSTFEGNDRAKKLFSDIREIIETGGRSKLEGGAK